MTDDNSKPGDLPIIQEPDFYNRGLFSDHFLQARLPEWQEWKVDEALEVFRKNLQSLYESKKSHLPSYNEAQTEDEFIKPVLDLLGYAGSYAVQVATKLGKQTGRLTMLCSQTPRPRTRRKLNSKTMIIASVSALPTPNTGNANLIFPSRILATPSPTSIHHSR